MSKGKKTLVVIGSILVATLPGGFPLIAGIYAINRYKKNRRKKAQNEIVKEAL